MKSLFVKNSHVLYNFMDTIQDTIRRSEALIKMGVTPYLQNYRPLTQLKSRSTYISPEWTLSYIRKVKYFYSLPTLYKKVSFSEWEKMGNPRLKNSKVKFDL